MKDKMNIKNKLISTFFLILLTMIFVYTDAIIINSESKPKNKLLNSKNKNINFDVVIVGGGNTSLSAAYDLNHYKILIIEKEDYIGGRIKTLHYEGINYEIGAIFAFPVSQLPFEVSTKEIINNISPLGIYYNKKLAYGNSINECLVNLKLNNDDLNEIEKFRQLLTDNLGKPDFTVVKVNSLLKLTNYKLINSCFKTIHPGEIKDYLPKFQQHAFYKFNYSYYPEGNYFFVSEYLKRLNSEILLESEVISVEDKGEYVEILYKDKKGDLKEIFAKTSIVATPGVIANKIIKHKNKGCEKFLNSLKYGKFTVVVLGINDGLLDDFSYIITVDSPFNTMFKSTKKQNDKEITILNIFYADKESQTIENYSNEKIISQIVDEITKIGIGKIKSSDVIFSKIERWKFGGTIISPESYGTWTEENRRPSKRVFLAGDYLDINFPYGLVGAIISGRKAAEMVDNFINKEKSI